MFFCSVPTGVSFVFAGDKDSIKVGGKKVLHTKEKSVQYSFGFED